MGNEIMQSLENLRDQDIIRHIDVELCRLLKERHPKMSDTVLLTACLVSHLYQQGHVCLPLEEYEHRKLFDDEESKVKAPALSTWVSALKESPAVGGPGEYTPLILDQSNRVYLHKLWHFEDTLVTELIEKSKKQFAKVDETLLKKWSCSIVWLQRAAQLAASSCGNVRTK